MSDASAGWRAEYEHAGVTPSIEGPVCDVRGCSEKFGLRMAGNGVMRVCRRHARKLFGGSS